MKHPRLLPVDQLDSNFGESVFPLCSERSHQPRLLPLYLTQIIQLVLNCFSQGEPVGFNWESADKQENIDVLNPSAASAFIFHYISLSPLLWEAEFVTQWPIVHWSMHQMLAYYNIIKYSFSLPLTPLFSYLVAH